MSREARELLACPFCGGEAAFEQIGSRVLAEGCAWSVGCENEQCLGFQSVTTYARKAEAASAWNTRAALQPQATTSDEVIERVARAICRTRLNRDGCWFDHGRLLHAENSQWRQDRDLARAALSAASLPGKETE